MEKHGWYFIMIMKETKNVEHIVEVVNLLGSLTVKSSDSYIIAISVAIQYWDHFYIKKIRVLYVQKLCYTTNNCPCKAVRDSCQFQVVS